MLSLDYSSSHTDLIIHRGSHFSVPVSSPYPQPNFHATSRAEAAVYPKGISAEHAHQETIKAGDNMHDDKPTSSCSPKPSKPHDRHCSYENLPQCPGQEAGANTVVGASGKDNLAVSHCHDTEWRRRFCTKRKSEMRMEGLRCSQKHMVETSR